MCEDKHTILVLRQKNLREISTDDMYSFFFFTPFCVLFLAMSGGENVDCNLLFRACEELWCSAGTCCHEQTQRKYV